MSLFYILSKFVAFFLNPANWIFILLLIAFFTKRKRLRKGLLVSAFIVFIVFSNEALYTKIANAWQPSPVNLPDSAGYSVGILLGGLSAADKHGVSFFNTSADRFIQTLQLYKRGVIKKILITGGTLDMAPDEGIYLVDEFVKAGIPAEDILSESKAMNTHENAVFSKVILDSLHYPPPYVVITSAFHVKRSKKVFDKAGLNVIMYPSAYLVINKPLLIGEYLIPKIKVLDEWKYMIKEIVGTWGYQLVNKA